MGKKFQELDTSKFKLMVVTDNLEIIKLNYHNTYFKITLKILKVFIY